MKIAELLIPELERETALTQEFLERIPEDRLGWKPHDKSMTLQQLGNHLAEIPSCIPPTIGYGRNGHGRL